MVEFSHVLKQGVQKVEEIINNNKWMCVKWQNYSENRIVAFVDKDEF